MDTAKKPLIIALAVLGSLVLVLAILFAATSPNRLVNKFEKQILAGDYDAAFALMSTNVAQDKIDNADYFITDWSYADEIEIEVTSDTSWLQRTKVDENGEPLLNKHGDRDIEIKPAPKYWSRFYEVEMDVEFDGFEDPVVMRLRRTSNDGWSPLAQLFRGWEITKIVYQPLGDEDYEELDLDEFDFDLGEQELLLDDSGEDYELEDGLTYFEADENDYYLYIEYPDTYTIDENGDTIINDENGNGIFAIRVQDLSSGLYLDSEKAGVSDVDGYDADRYEVESEGVQRLAYVLEMTDTSHLVLEFFGDYELTGEEENIFDSLYVELYGEE